MEDNKACARAMREAHKLCDDAEDSGTAGLLETFIDETEKRTWFLFEARARAQIPPVTDGREALGGAQALVARRSRP